MLLIFIIVVSIIIIFYKIIFLNKPNVNKELKKKIIEESIDFQNVIYSSSHAQQLYNELKAVCHPDLFSDPMTKEKAQVIFQQITENKWDYNSLVKLKKRAQEEIGIN